MKTSVTCSGREPDRARLALRLLAVLAAVAAATAALLVANTQPPARAEAITLIYVGAADCAPCRAWQNGDGAAFRRSADFARIGYVEVKSARLRDVLADANWPDPIRPYRDRIRQSDGVPLWLIVSRGEVTEQRSGPAAWRGIVLPAIKSALRQGRLRPASPPRQPPLAEASRSS